MIIEEIAQYLDAQNIGTYSPDSIGGNIFLSRMPDSPDTCITIYASVGLAPDVKTNLKRPGVQVMVRGSQELAQSVYDALHSPAAKTFVDGGTLVLLCAAKQSEPIPLGPDQNGRMEYSMNFQLITGG